jgi:hypothetical protein
MDNIIYCIIPLEGVKSLHLQYVNLMLQLIHNKYLIIIVLAKDYFKKILYFIMLKCYFMNMRSFLGSLKGLQLLFLNIIIYRIL